MSTAFKIIIFHVLLFFCCYSQSVISTVADSIPSTPAAATVALGIGGAAAVTVLLLHDDQNIYDEIHGWREHNTFIRKVSPVITNMGDGAFSMALFGGFAGYGLLWKDTKAMEVAKIGAESFLLTGISVQLLKHLCGRERPSDATRPGGFWNGPFLSFQGEKKRGLAAFDSFPSGHTATAFAAATTISDFYTAPWVSYTSYSVASVVAISRVMESTHWISDCFIGALIGHYGTRLVEKLNYGSTAITLSPQADEHQYGLLLSVKF